MARNNFTFEKRRRELEKKAKKEARKVAKEENKARAEAGLEVLADADGLEADGPDVDGPGVAPGVADAPAAPEKP